MDFVQQQYWDNSYQNFKYRIAEDDITNWINKHEHLFLNKGSLFEFGCYPGRYLSFMGKKGWTVNGLDLTPDIEGRFIAWLHDESIKTGLLKKIDAVSYAASTTDRYDFVCSFGFIEHFSNFLHLIELHDRILKPEGWLVITTPNFKGFVQRVLHKNLNHESLKMHYLPSMQPLLWKQKLESLGYIIHFSGYFGGFDFWYDEQPRNRMQKIGLKIVGKINRIIRRLPDHQSYSPYCGIIAQKCLV
jgi:SAM-dependent methyltransferase